MPSPSAFSVDASNEQQKKRKKVLAGGACLVSLTAGGHPLRRKIGLTDEIIDAVSQYDPGGAEKASRWQNYLPGAFSKGRGGAKKQFR